MKNYFTVAAFCIIIYIIGFVHNIKGEDYLKRDWINLYGFVQNVLDKEQIENFTLYKTSYNKIVSPREAVEDAEIEKNANNIELIQEYCSNRDIPMFYITSILPICDEDILPSGIKDYSKRNQEKLHKRLENTAVSMIHLQQKDSILNIEQEDLFYRTDHHWSIETCFAAFQEIIWHLENSLNWNLDSDKKFTNLESYEKITYEKSFLGSYGVKVGEYYLGADDFEIYIPKYETDFIFEKYDANHEMIMRKKGDFFKSMMDEEIIQDKNYYNKYNSFSNGGYIENRVFNNKADNDKKILLISHSYGRPLLQYLSLCFKEVRNLDPQEGRYNDDYFKYIDEYEPDLILIMNEFEGEITNEIAIQLNSN